MLVGLVKNKLFVFGLTKRNIEHLKEGHPLMIDLKQYGLGDKKVLFFYEEEEETMLDTLKRNKVIQGDEEVVMLPADRGELQ
jgi:hypothetical protein